MKENQDKIGHYKTQEEFEKACERIPERCGECEHLMCFPHLRWVYCQKGKPFKGDCECFLDAEGYRSRNRGNEPLPVAWEREYAYTSDRFLDTPFCPSCHEYADIDLGHCRFCGQPFLGGDDRREPNVEATYERDGHAWRLIEVGGYLDQWLERDGEALMHIQNRTPHDEGELLIRLIRLAEGWHKSPDPQKKGGE